MKYAVIAALLATSNAAELTGCKKGLKAKFYKDSKCEKDSHGTMTSLESDLAKTGKCQPHTATADDHKYLKTATQNLESSKKNSAAAATIVKNNPKLDTDGSGTMKTCKEHYSAKWADVMALKKEWATNMVAAEAELAKYKK